MIQPKKSEMSKHWRLNEETVFLNHGSYGATPTIVLNEQKRWQLLLEKDPVKFFEDIAPKALIESRKAIANLVNCDYEDLALIENATSGVNIILRSLKFDEGDEIIVPNHAYQACRNTIDYVAEKSGAVVVTCDIPFPIQGNQIIIDNIMKCVTENTKLAMIDTVTSPTGLLMPFEELVGLLESKGVNVLLDAAHGIGMIPLDIEKIGASYTTSNCHKWLCAPKGSAFLHVRKDLQSLIHPLTISHGMTAPLGDSTRFRHEFDWTGTRDVSAWCALPFVIDEFSKLVGMNWNEIMTHNRKLVIKGRNIICEKLSIIPPCPENMISSIATIKISSKQVSITDLYEIDPLHEKLLEDYNIQVPVWSWPNPQGRYIRISAQIYNNEAEYKYLANILEKCL
ncbi:aminotransferase class V-fold PLP-dependent enzyme [Euryarchaeota archaeon]|nr:aminotransferase class V-fold PLP-dependent enzyme [Euryarchaeota archaeon]MDC0962721.1 aminotransferase class V-fold PLP-dependent enzyme [Euryarchaeota archaeon]